MGYPVGKPNFGTVLRDVFKYNLFLMFSKLQLCVYNYNVANLSPTINKIVIFLTDPFCFLLIFCKGQYLILGNPVHLDIRNWCFLTVLLSYSYHYYLLLTFVLS